MDKGYLDRFCEHAAEDERKRVTIVDTKNGPMEYKLKHVTNTGLTHKEKLKNKIT